MNKSILLTASAVIALGFVSCEDEGEYSLELTSGNIEKLATVMSNVDLSPSVEFEGEIDALNSDLLLKESMSEDCEDGGSQTVNETEAGDVSTYDATFTQCSEDGMTRTGSMTSVVDFSSGSFSATGDFTITGLSGVTSLEYKDLVMSGELIGSINMTVDVTIVSDDVSGSFGYSIVGSDEGQTLKLSGADGTEYSAVYTGDVGVCTLNEKVVTCIEVE